MEAGVGQDHGLVSLFTPVACEFHTLTPRSAQCTIRGVTLSPNPYHPYKRANRALSGCYGLRYVEEYDGGWYSDAVDGEYAGMYTSLALDADGYPHISHYDQGNRDLRYA